MAKLVLSLRERIEALPDELRDALERAAKCRRLVAEIQQEIEVEKRLADAELVSEDDADATMRSQYEQELATQQFAVEVERIKLRLAEAENTAEVAFRERVVKPTDTYVRAAVGADPRVVELRTALAEAKARLQREELTLRYQDDQRREQARAQRDRDRASYRRRGAETENDKVTALRTKLFQAQEQLDRAEATVEVAHVMVDTYRMLLTLSDLERPLV